MNKEIEVILDGTMHIMRPTFKALSRIEQELDTGIMALAKKLVDGVMTLEELAVIVIHCVETQTPHELLKEALVHSGIEHVTQAVAAMFSHVFAKKSADISDANPPKAF